MMPVYIAAGVGLAALGGPFPHWLQQVGIGLGLGALGATAPFLVANYLRLRRKSA